MEQQPPEAKPAGSSWFERKEYVDEAEKKRDFWIGVGLWFGLNFVMGLCVWGISAALLSMTYPSEGINEQFANLYPAINCILNLLPWVINIGLIVYFAFTRSQIALGMVAGFGIALAIAICLGVIFMIACFVALGTLGG